MASFSKVKSRKVFGPKKLLSVCRLCIQDQSFINFEIHAMKVSVTKKSNEAKLTDLGAGNCATIKQILISKFAFGPEKLSGLSRNGPQI